MKSGALCQLIQKRESVPIRARRVPETIGGRRSKLGRDGLTNDKLLERVYVCDIPAGSQVLYMSTKVDAFSRLMAGRTTSPYGYKPNEIVFHLILWQDRPAWVCSEDAELREIE